MPPRTPTGRSSSKESRRRSAPANARSSCRRSSSCRGSTRRGDDVVRARAAVGITGRGARGRARAGGERRKPDWRPGGEHQDPRARFEIPRDEKRRRFAERLRRDHAGPKAPRAIGRRTAAGSRQRAVESPPSADRGARAPRDDRRDRRARARGSRCATAAPGPAPGDRPWRPTGLTGSRSHREPAPQSAIGPRAPTRRAVATARRPREDRGARPPRQDENRGDRPWRPKPSRRPGPRPDRGDHEPATIAARAPRGGPRPTPAAPGRESRRSPGARQPTGSRSRLATAARPSRRSHRESGPPARGPCPPAAPGRESRRPAVRAARSRPATAARKSAVAAAGSGGLPDSGRRALAAPVDEAPGVDPAAAVPGIAGRSRGPGGRGPLGRRLPRTGRQTARWTRPRRRRRRRARGDHPRRPVQPASGRSARRRRPRFSRASTARSSSARPFARAGSAVASATVCPATSSRCARTFGTSLELEFDDVGRAARLPRTPGSRGDRRILHERRERGAGVRL